jgi:hypothetical protein
MRHLACIAVSACMVVLIVTPTIAQQKTSSIQTHKVMSNPYDDVLRIQKKQSDAVDENELKIRQLFLQSGRKTHNSEAVINGQVQRIRENPEEIDQKSTLDLLNLDVVVKADRISEEDVKRDWMVPSISMLKDGDETLGKPENLFLKDWELMRSKTNTPLVGRTGDPLSRIEVRVGMILGEFGRIMAVRDTGDAYYLILESGDRIQGAPANG